MTARLRIVWEERKFDEVVENFDFRNTFPEVNKTLLCGKFEEPFSIDQYIIETIHFTNFTFLVNNFTFVLGQPIFHRSFTLAVSGSGSLHIFSSAFEEQFE